jgi:Na+-driven multidrug efflux pump
VNQRRVLVMSFVSGFQLCASLLLQGSGERVFCLACSLFCMWVLYAERTL